MTFTRRIVLIAVLVPLLLPASPQKTVEPPLIQTILKGTAAYCERLNHAAFRFTCLEKVKQRSRRWGRHEFVYDYQLIKEKGSIQEQRILKRKDGKRVSSPKDALSRRFSAELFTYRAALAPIYLFGKEFRYRFRFAVTGKRRLLGRSAWEVTIFRRPDSPLPAPLIVRKKHNQAVLGPVQGEPRVVTAWVDRQDYSVLGFRVYPAGVSGYNDIAKAAFRRGLRVKVKDIHLFGLERKGIRYPTRTEITLTYSPLDVRAAPVVHQYGHVPGVASILGSVAGGRRGASQLKVSTVFTYTRHRFFTAKSADPEYPDLE